MPFTTGGIAAEMIKFERIILGSEAACEKAVIAGGKMLAEKLKAAARDKNFSHKGNPHRTGGLVKSIRAMPVKYSAADGFTCEVTPQGKHPVTGEPYAKIGNILEYGRSNMEASPWFNPAVKAAEDEIIAAMQKIIDAETQGGA